MRQYLAHRVDVRIDRDNPNFPASAVLLDADGELLNRFDEDWTDDQILAALDFANRTYNTAFNAGLRSKAAEIRIALNVAEIASDE